MFFRKIALSLALIVGSNVVQAQTPECAPLVDQGYTIHRDRYGCPTFAPEYKDANGAEALLAVQRYELDWTHFVNVAKPKQLGFLCQMLGVSCNAQAVIARCPKFGTQGPGYPEDCRSGVPPQIAPHQASAGDHYQQQFETLLSLLPSAAKNRVLSLFHTALAVVDNYSAASASTLTKLQNGLFSQLLRKIAAGRQLSESDLTRLEQAVATFVQTTMIRSTNIANRLAVIRALLKFSLPVSQIAYGDMNKDGTLDQAFVYEPQQQVVILLKSREYGYFYPTQVISMPGVRGVALVDVNGDGKLDLVVRLEGFDIQLLGNGQGQFN